MTPTFHSRGDAKSRKGERHGSFWEMILWKDVRILVLKIMELERIEAPAGPLTIVVFLEAVPTVVLKIILGASEQHAPELWGMWVWTGVPSG